MEADSKDPKTILEEVGFDRSRSRDRLMFFTPLKFSQTKEGTSITPPEPAVDSMGFPLASSSKKLSEDLPWGSDFSSTNLFACDNYVRGFSSPVSVTATLGTRSCAWCGLGGRDANAIKELKVCTACQLTY